MRKKLPDEVRDYLQHHPDVVEIVGDFWNEEPTLRTILQPLLRSYVAITNSFENGGRLFLCGNGGSYADCLHISGEMLKSYERNRKLSEEDRKIFAEHPYGEELSQHLEYGFPAMVLGLNPSLKTAVENDIPLPDMAFAQELFAFGRSEDVLLGISTSGNAKNVLYTVTTAKAIGMRTIALTGKSGGELAGAVDFAIQAPHDKTNRVQELHQKIYHTLCSMVEAHYFPEQGK